MDTITCTEIMPSKVQSGSQDDSKLETFSIKSKQVRALTHKEMVEAVELGKLNPVVYEKEMLRRKEAREQRKTLRQKQGFILKNGKKETKVNLVVPVVESGQEIFDLPLTLDAFDAMVAFYTSDKPFWKKKMEFYKRSIPEKEFLFKLNSCVNSLYAKGTVEYFADLIWGSRRLRDKFMDFFESAMDVAVVQCAEPELEEIKENHDLFIVFEEEDFPMESDTESVSWNESDSESDEFGFSIDFVNPEFEGDIMEWDDSDIVLSIYEDETLGEYLDWRTYEEDYDWECFAQYMYDQWEAEDLEWNAVPLNFNPYWTPALHNEFRPDVVFDGAVVQSDEPVLEEEVSVAGHGNMTFVEERATDSDSSHIAPSISASDPLCTMAEREWITTKALLEREIIVHRGTWNETSRGLIHQVGIPKCFFTGTNTFVKRQLQVAAFLRAGVEFRIQFNGNKFACGSLVFCLMPPMFEEDANNYPTMQCFNWPHVRVDAAVSNVGTLFVPFTHILTHFPQRAGSLESDSICTLGRLMTYVVNDLKVGEGASNELNYTVYARFVNPEIHQTTWPIEKFSYSDGIITQAGGEGEGLFKKIIGGGLTTALGGFLSKMTGGLAVGLGNMLTGLIFDYPRDPSPPTHMVNNAISPICYGAGVDHSTRLTLTPVSQQEMTAGILGSTNGDFDLKTLLQIPSLIETVAWTAADIPGTEIFSMPVTPVYMGYNRSVPQKNEHVCRYVPTMQAYICRAFCYWNGGMKLKIQIIKTEYNNGRLLVAYIPYETPVTRPSKEDGYTDDDILEFYNQANVVVIDIEEQKEVVIDLPYMSPRPWLRCDAFRSNYTFKNNDDDNVYSTPNLAEEYCGFVRIFVLNRLVAPSNVPQSIDVNVFLSCDNDFELAYPTSLAPLNIKSYGQGSFGGFQEYPFILGDLKENYKKTDFQNQMWIKALYYDGERLFNFGKLKIPEKKRWYQAEPTYVLGTTDDETLVWSYKASLMAKYFNFEGEAPVQSLLLAALPDWEKAKTQAIEEYTTNRTKEPVSITATEGKRTCEVAPSTVSENGMQLSTIMRRFYCIHNSVPIYSQTGYTVVSIPVNPSFMPVVRYPVDSNEHVGYGEALPIDQVAWFVKLYTYWGGSTRYKVLFDSDVSDVEVVHVPTECRRWSVRTGVKEIDLQRLMAYGSAVAVSQVQGALEVEVPYASPYTQLFVDAHNKFFDMRCQNGTLFVCFRNKRRVAASQITPLTFSLFRAIGDDFFLNLLRAPPIVEEPRMTYGYCEEDRKAIALYAPESARNLGDDSHKVPMPGCTGFKKIDKIGYLGECKALDETEKAITQGLEEIAEQEKAVAQMFGGIRDAVAEVSKTHNVIQDTALRLNHTLKESNLEETLKSLNSVSRKLDSFAEKAESTANNFTMDNDTVKKYALIASEVVLCGTFVHQIKTVLENPTLANFVTMGIEFGLIVGLSVSETLQSLLMRVVDWAMNAKIIQPEQARAQAFDGATDFVDEHCGVLCTIVAVLGTVMYGYMFGVLPSFSKIKEVIKSYFEEEDESPAKVQSLEKVFGINLKNAHFSLLGLGALEKVYNKLMEWAQKLLYWMMDKENPEVVLARAAVDVRERVLNLIRELDELDYEPNFVAALAEPLVHNRFYRLQDEVYELTAMCTDSKVDQRVVMLLTECRRRATELIRRLEADGTSATCRYDPMVICLHGENRTGKTRFSEKIFDIAREVMGLPKHHLVYSKNIRDDYWSGYSRQPIIFWDEYGQSKEADKVSIPEFMTLRGDKPVKVNMASLAEKGRDFTSQLIVQTTNVPYQVYNSVRDNQAHMNRRHVMIKMAYRPGFDADTLTDAAHDAYPNWEHCVFSLTERARNRTIRDNMDMQQVLDHVRAEMTRYHENQLAKLAQVQIPNLPRGVIPNPELADLDLDLGSLHSDDSESESDDSEFSDASDVSMTPSQEQMAEELVANALEAIPEEEFAFAEEEFQFENPFERLQIQMMEEFDWNQKAWFIIDKAQNLNDLERFAAELFISKVDAMKAEDQVRTYVRAKRAFSRKVSKMYEATVSMFDSMISKVRNFWNNNPKFCKVLGVLTLLGGVGAIMHFRSKADPEHYESGPARAPARRVVPESTYQSGPTRPANTRVIPEGSEDIQATEIATKVSQYVYPLAWREGSTRTAKLNCLHIGGHVILAPMHFFTHAKEGEYFDVQHRVHPVIIEFRKENLYNVEGKDWALYNCGVRLEAGKQLKQFFIDENNLGKVRQAKCTLITQDRQSKTIIHTQGNVVPQQVFAYEDDHWGDQYTQTGWKHDLNTTVGQCGGPLIICSNALPSPGKIAGIHVAGYAKKSCGYVVLITKQMLEVGLGKFGMLPAPAVIPQCVEVGLHKNLRLVPDGDFTIVGKMPDKMSPAQPLKTTFVETPFQDLAIEEVGPVPKIPAKLRPFEENGERISPLKKAIVKYGYLTIPFSQRNLKKVENYLVHMFDQKLTKHTGKRVFSIPEAVNGLPGVEFAEKMNMKSSPGWPYQMEQRLPGKWHLFDVNGNIIDKSVIDRLEARRKAAEKLERVESVWRDCMKDELRPVKKVNAGKTRLFTIAPVDFTILARQMFLDFIMAFYGAFNDDFFSAVGINPESTDWTELYNYLAEFSTQVVAGDYECFDGKEMPEIIMMVCHVINAWYGDSPENQRIRETLFLEMIHTMQLCENLVYMTHQGNPSGNPLTTIINTIVNLVLLILVWLELMPDKTIDDFFKNVRVKAYGDDNLIAVKAKFQAKYNQNTIAQALLRHNIVYTAEMKDGLEVPDTRPLKEVSFLKRGFRKDGEFGNLFWLPTMSLETLNSYFYFYRFSTCPQEQIQENQRSALLFAAFHGRVYYEDYLAKWKRFMKSVGMESLQISFEEQVDCFQWGAGMMEKRPQSVFKSSIFVESMEKFMQVTNSKPVRSVLGAIEAPFYYLAACLGICVTDVTESPEDDRWAIAIPSGEGKSTLARTYPWLFVDHDELLLPKFTEGRSLPWKAEVARELDFPAEDRRVLLVHHPSFTKRRLVGSFITPFPTFIRVNCIQRLKLKDPVKMSMSERNILLVQLCTALEPNLKRSELKLYTHAPSCLDQPAGVCTT